MRKMKRCSWARSELEIQYHDHEWGVPLHDDSALFELLMRRYNERVYRAARSIVRDEHETEDVMQQVYVNAFTHLSQFNGAARFSTWLTRIAVNEALARVRRQGRYDSFDEQRSNVEPFATHHP